jgi:thiol-disulfide isomerase/thioredoxin
MVGNAHALIDEITESMERSGDQETLAYLRTRKEQIDLMGTEFSKPQLVDYVHVGHVPPPTKPDISKSVVLLYFWASHIDSCRFLFPFLNDLKKKYHPQGLEIIGVTDLFGQVFGYAQEEESRLKREEEIRILNEFFKKGEIQFNSLIDEDHRLMKALKVRENELPHIVLLDRKGTIRFFWSIGGGEIKPFLDEIVRNLLKEKEQGKD